MDIGLSRKPRGETADIHVGIPSLERQPATEILTPFLTPEDYGLHWGQQDGGRAAEHARDTVPLGHPVLRKDSIRAQNGQPLTDLALGQSRLHSRLP